MHSANRRSAWFQGLSLVAFIGALATLLLLEAYRPFDRDTLTILTGQLRSDAHEAHELTRLDAAHASYGTFTQQHARQLDEHVADLANALRGNRAVDALEPVRREAADLARDIDTALSAVAADHAAAGEKAAQFDRLGERAEMLHRRAAAGG